MKKQILDFWNSRVEFGENAGTNDIMVKHLEEEILLDRIPFEAEVFDIGCGNGAALIRLAKEKNCSGLGIDYSGNLIDLAKQTVAENGFGNKLKFKNCSVLDNYGSKKWKYIITKRCLINLDNLEEQEKAFSKIVDSLEVGGYYFMIESFNDGNRLLNTHRKLLGLEALAAPWHNTFFELKEVLGWQEKYSSVAATDVSHFASTYYFLSRVVYAKLAALSGETLKYDSDINKISLQLPVTGEFGATKLVVWRKIK